MCEDCISWPGWAIIFIQGHLIARLNAWLTFLSEKELVWVSFRFLDFSWRLQLERRLCEVNDVVRLLSGKQFQDFKRFSLWKQIQQREQLLLSCLESAVATLTFPAFHQFSPHTSSSCACGGGQGHCFLKVLRWSLRSGPWKVNERDLFCKDESAFMKDKPASAKRCLNSVPT